MTVNFREGSFPALSSTRSHAEGTRRMRGRCWHKNSLQRFLITNSAHRIKSIAGYIHRGPAAGLARLKCWHNYKFPPIISRAIALERKVMRAAPACRWDLNLERIRPHDMDIWRWRIWTHQGTFVRPYYFGENWHVYLRPKCSENYPFLIISHSKWLGLAW